MNDCRSRREIATRIDVMEQTPLYIRVHPNDNVAIVVNDGGLGEGAVFPKRPTCLIAYTLRMSTYEMQVPYKLGTSRRILRTSKI